MVEIEDKLISDDMFTKQFVCDLQKCKGACCIEGDSGAPLTEKEAKDIDLNIDSSSLMSESAVAEEDKTARLLRKADMLLANAPPVKKTLDAAPSAKTTNGSMDKTEMLLQKADMLLASSKR